MSLVESFDAFEPGDVLCIDGIDYIITIKGGKNVAERFNKEWHNDVFDICDPSPFEAFIAEVVWELTSSFPKLAPRLTHSQHLELAACLWKQFNIADRAQTPCV